jgi:2-amino-4-hydroxy-6-hydroxymethyldihydropteridine diphosphokinase
LRRTKSDEVLLLRGGSELNFGDAGGVGTEIHKAGIGLGSNLGESINILQAAWRRLQDHPEIIPLALSPPYRSQPVEMISTRWFVNAAALIRTTLTPLALLQALQTIETRSGRARSRQTTGYQDRTLDLDLLFYDDLVVHSDSLVIPHPRMEQRLFVLVPLCDIAAEYVHPLLRKKVRDLHGDLLKNSVNQAVEKLSWLQ